MEDNAQSLVEIHVHEGRFLPKQYIGLVKIRWIRSYRRNNSFMELVDPIAYDFFYKPYVEGILHRPKTTVRLAVLGDDNDVTLGFSVTEGNILHYVEVKKDYRKQGLATSLVPDGIEWITHLTKTGMRIWSVKLPKAKFNPFL